MRFRIPLFSRIKDLEAENARLILDNTQLTIDMSVLQQISMVHITVSHKGKGLMRASASAIYTLLKYGAEDGTFFNVFPANTGDVGVTFDHPSLVRSK